MVKTIGYSDYSDTLWETSWAEHYQKTELEILLCPSCREFIRNHPILDRGLKKKCAERIVESEAAKEMLSNGWKFVVDTFHKGKDPGVMLSDAVAHFIKYERT